MNSVAQVRVSTMQYRLLLIRIVLAFSACDSRPSETFLEQTDEPVILMGEFVSYSSIEDIRMTHQFGDNWEVVEDSKHASSEGRPPFNDYRVRVSSYQHFNCEGELKLEFFNNRLQSVWFYPNDIDAYLGKLNEVGVSVSKGVPSILDDWVSWQHTSVWSSVDFQNRRYVIWEDKRLTQQMHRWVELYA